MNWRRCPIAPGNGSRCDADDQIEGETVRCSENAIELIYLEDLGVYKAVCNHHFKSLPPEGEFLATMNVQFGDPNAK